ncbi:MAG: hypothetical protein C0476_09100 [Sphingomonas sp.]|nr:hypothetical protein [Sphingomonas sp.]
MPSLLSRGPVVRVPMLPLSAPVREKFVEQGPDQLSSPFTKATVLKLNAIVRKSQVIIDEFDLDIPAIRKAVAAGAAPRASSAARARANTSLASLATLASRAQVNRADMQRAERQVRTSGEKYNDTILAAMVAFCVDVDTELRTEHRMLAAKLKRG